MMILLDFSSLSGFAANVFVPRDARAAAPAEPDLAVCQAPMYPAVELAVNREG